MDGWVILLVLTHLLTLDTGLRAHLTSHLHIQVYTMDRRPTTQIHFIMDMVIQSMPIVRTTVSLTGPLQPLRLRLLRRTSLLQRLLLLAIKMIHPLKTRLPMLSE
jgi:hypothetical protein